MFHNFESLGWPDPWKKTDNLQQGKKKPENMTDSVKKLQALRTEDDKTNLNESQYCYWDAPFEPPKSTKCVVKPSKVVLFNIIRACAGVEKPDDIWVKVETEDNGD